MGITGSNIDAGVEGDEYLVVMAFKSWELSRSSILGAGELLRVATAVKGLGEIAEEVTTWVGSKLVLGEKVVEESSPSQQSDEA